MSHRFSRAVLAGGKLLPLAAAALMMSSCSRDELLGVETPDQITPEAAANAAGANAQRVAAIGNFAAFYAGDYGGSFHGLAITAGLLADEIESARGGTEHLDSRAQNESLTPQTTTWFFAGQAQTQLIRAIRVVNQYVPESPTRTNQLAELFALRGFTFVLLGENYCSAVPIGNANDDDPQTEVLDNTQLFQRAIVMFDSALTVLGTQTNAGLRNLVAVGRGRALLDLNQPDQAAAAVASVPTTFSHNISYSATTVVNSIYNWMNATLNYAPADREGGNGIDFVSANDPRVTVRRDANTGAPVRQRGQDGIEHVVQTVHTVGTSPVPLATGIEARLIEAEALVRVNDPTYISKLNDARASRPTLGLTALAPAVGQPAQVDQVMRERAFWFWGTAHRIGDLRRLMTQYGRAENTVWPTGPYFKGGNFGNHVNLMPAQAEQNNELYKDPRTVGCDPTRAAFTKA
ncbi:MAG: hypothetical protein ABR499_11290 [Gemmatimonadaceae bacterium]